MRNSNNIDIKKNESDFQIAYANWTATKEQRYYDTMWFCVNAACSNIAKSIYKRRGVIVPDDKLEDVITDSTAYVMEFIRNRNVKPDKLSSYCYLRVLRYINDPKDRQWNEKISEMSVEDVLFYKENNENEFKSKTY